MYYKWRNKLDHNNVVTDGIKIYFMQTYRVFSLNLVIIHNKLD